MLSRRMGVTCMTSDGVLEGAERIAEPATESFRVYARKVPQWSSAAVLPRNQSRLLRKGRNCGRNPTTSILLPQSELKREADVRERVGQVPQFRPDDPAHPFHSTWWRGAATLNGRLTDHCGREASSSAIKRPIAAIDSCAR